ncbi:hypothetical protein BZG17_34250, partial [Escherichia coli]|nr:hypothetical protein [Escherichia coli]
ESKSDGEADRLARSGFGMFEEEFNRFAGRELADLAVGGAAEELSRVAQRLEQRAQDAAQGEEVLQRRRAELSAGMEQSRVRIEAFAGRTMKEELAQETGELL